MWRVWQAALAVAATSAGAQEPVPEGAVLLNKYGLILDFKPRVREFFGAIIDDEAYVWDADDLAKVDRDYPGRAPHRVEFVYGRVPLPSAKRVPLSDDEIHALGKAAFQQHCGRPHRFECLQPWVVALVRDALAAQCKEAGHDAV
jgi:hypothetical protein